MSSRYERASLIVTSNKPFGRWGEVFGDDVVAAAMIDRLVHHAEVISLKGDSYRLKDRDLGRVPADRRPSSAMTAARLIPAVTRGVSAGSHPEGSIRRRTSRSDRYPATIADPSPPSTRSAARLGDRTRAAVAQTWAPSIITGADKAVPMSSESRPTVDS